MLPALFTQAEKENFFSFSFEKIRVGPLYAECIVALRQPSVGIEAIFVRRGAENDGRITKIIFTSADRLGGTELF